MSSKNCLNCGYELIHQFCAHCGQKADTHRITVKHFIAHDLIHGVFHLDKGILFTLKEAFTRPGKAAMDYINGKRISYYNIFYLILLLVGLNLLVQHYINVLRPKSNVVQATGDGVKLLDFFRHNIKYVILSFIPLFAFNSWLIFRRLKLNFAEHHIISGFVLLGCSVIMLVNKLFDLLPFAVLSSPVGILKGLIQILMLLFPIYVYYMAFAKQYKLLGFSWRVLLVYFLFFVEFFIGIVLIFGYLSGGEFDGQMLIK